jgi:hypothetical protein
MNRLPFEPCEFFRVQLGSLYRELPPRTVFIESQTEKAARMRVANAIGGLEFRSVPEVMERIIDVRSARQCIEEGRHEDEALRIFEMEQTLAGPDVTEHPVFLTLEPGKFSRLWARAVGLTNENSTAPSGLEFRRLAGEAVTRVMLNTCVRDFVMTVRVGDQLIEELRRRGLAVTPTAKSY